MRISRDYRFAHRITTLFLSWTLALSLLPAEAFAATQRVVPVPTQDQIDELLQKQDYVPGEVIVVAEAGARLNGEDAEQLAEADSEALDLTADAAQADPDTAQAVSAQRADQSRANTYEVTIVRSDTKTTAQLIEELYANPQVVSVEPNYVTSVERDEDASTAEATGTADANASANPTLSAADDGTTHPEAGDLSSQQWGMQNKGIYGTFEGAAVEGIDMDVPGWDAFHADSSSSAQDYVNSSGVIAITDSGMDLTHPDLKGVLYTFTAEQQAKYGCGPHGFNASAAGNASVADGVNHGTHVSGIAAAAWDHEGVSGVANGAKLISVCLSDETGSQSLESGARAFNFLIQCAREINLKSVNCSWSGPGVEFTYTLLVNQLGAEGAVTVFASGNENKNMGITVDTGSFIDSPYLISVNALNPAGTRAGFSNYSITSTDVFSPGAEIISTVPGSIAAKSADGEGSIYRYFGPTSATDEGVLSFETFANGGSGTTAYASDPTKAGAKAIGAVSSDGGADDGYSYRVPIADLLSDGDLAGMADADESAEASAEDGAAVAAEDESGDNEEDVAAGAGEDAAEIAGEGATGDAADEASAAEDADDGTASNESADTGANGSTDDALSADGTGSGTIAGAAGESAGNAGNDPSAGASNVAAAGNEAAIVASATATGDTDDTATDGEADAAVATDGNVTAAGDEVSALAAASNDETANSEANETSGIVTTNAADKLMAASADGTAGSDANEAGEAGAASATTTTVGVGATDGSATTVETGTAAGKLTAASADGTAGSDADDADTVSETDGAATTGGVAAAANATTSGTAEELTATSPDDATTNATTGAAATTGSTAIDVTTDATTTTGGADATGTISATTGAPDASSLESTDGADAAANPVALEASSQATASGVSANNPSALSDGEDDEDEEDDSVTHGYGNTFYIAVPVSDQNAAISYVSARFAANQLSLDQMKIGLFGIVATTKDGGTKVVDLSHAKDGYYASTDARAGYFGWMNSTLCVEPLLASDAEAQGVYRDAQGRIIVKVGISTEAEIDYEAVYLDNVAVGGQDAKAGAYRLMHGTSMAAPAVTGALAVIAKDEPANAASDDPGQLALERAARLRAATVWSSALEGQCATGGYVNLAAYDNVTPSTNGKKAPIITAADAENDGLMLVDGYFFSTGGEVFVDGEKVEADSWDDECLELTLPTGLSNGAHVLTVATQDGRDKFAFSYTAEEDQLRLYERDLSIPDFETAKELYGEKGIGHLGGGFIASGDYLYTLGLFPDETAACLWRYSIEDDEWSVCGKLPTDKIAPYGTIIAPTKDGLVLYQNFTEDDEDLTTTTALYDYNAESDSWTKRTLPCEIPDAANIFTKGDDLYFVGGSLGYGNRHYLWVLRDGATKVESLDDLAEEDEYATLAPADVAVTDGYVYVTGARSHALTRLKIDENGKMTEVTDLMDSLVGRVTSRSRVEHPLAVAATPKGIFTVGTELEGTDTYQMIDGEDMITAFDYTSSFYRSETHAAVWHNGVLYAIGYSPSEPNRMYFRAQDYPVDEEEEEEDPVDDEDEDEEDVDDEDEEEEDDPVEDEDDGEGGANEESEGIDGKDEPSSSEVTPKETTDDDDDAMTESSNAGKRASTSTLTASSSAKAQPLAKTGDEQLPFAALGLGGAVALVVGLAARRRQRKA